MSSRSIVRRLRAWHYGEPLTRGQTIHTATADVADRLVLAFLKMGGETRPWAVAWKQGKQAVRFRSVPEPRFRAGVDEMVVELAKVLASHLRHPAYAEQVASEATDLAPLRQIWVPNGTHIDMLHHFAYTYARRALERPDATALRLLGRTALYAFLESQRPGQQLVMSASDALRSAYDFPAEDTRQAHLGFLLAWLSARGDRDRGLSAALEAERQPIATALLPELERDELTPIVEAYNEARRADNRAEMDRTTGTIGSLLEPELERRLTLVQEAIDVIEADPRPVNPGLEQLNRETLKSLWYGYVRPEQTAVARGREPFVPSAETDFQATGAGQRYFRNEAAADRAFAALVHADRELEAEAIATGRAFRGSITKVWDESPNRRKTIPVWRLEDPAPGSLSLRRGDRVCVVGHAKRSGAIRLIESTNGGGLALEIEITNIKTAANSEPWPNSMRAADERWIGQAMTVINTSFADMADKKAMSLFSNDELPGDWLLRAKDSDNAPTSDVVEDGAFVEVPA